MTRARKTDAAARSEPVEAPSALPSYCGALSFQTEASALDIIGRGDPLVVGPTYVLDAGAHVAMVRYSGAVLRVYDAAGDFRGVFASWGAARATVFGLVAEWETAEDLSAA